jgi:maleate isomerase
MTRRLRLGILTPSSNTALEPLSQDLIRSVNEQYPKFHISVHFSRFPVTTISLSPDGLAQFDLLPIISAATLLSHADVDIIGWSGTSAGWLGFERDVELCKEIEEATGVPATTSVLALNKALQIWNLKEMGLVTPYHDDVQEAIIHNYKRAGVVVGPGMECHLQVDTNKDIADIEEIVLDEMVKQVVHAGAPVVTTFCTNLVAAQRVSYWEKLHNVPVFDTVTTVIWEMLQMCGMEVGGVQGWGSIFTGPNQATT